MDERAEIWIARDPDSNTVSRPVSLRKLRKGVRIGRLQPSMLVTRVGANEWITLERFLAEAEAATPLAPPAAPPPLPQRVKPPSVAPPPPLPPEPSVELTPEPEPPRSLTPTVPPAARIEPSADASASLTARWFTEPAPEIDDDEPIFVSRSLLDLSFDRVMSTKLVKLTYVLLLVTLSACVLASIVHVGAAVAGGSGQQIATALAIVPVVVLGCAVIGAFGRMALEVMLALFRISDKLSRLAETR
jgi:hypothetical protein